jgi:hypothetical protein
MPLPLSLAFSPSQLCQRQHGDWLSPDGVDGLGKAGEGVGDRLEAIQRIGVEGIDLKKVQS